MKLFFSIQLLICSLNIFAISPITAIQKTFCHSNIEKVLGLKKAYQFKLAQQNDEMIQLRVTDYELDLANPLQKFPSAPNKDAYYVKLDNILKEKIDSNMDNTLNILSSELYIHKNSFYLRFNVIADPHVDIYSAIRHQKSDLFKNVKSWQGPFYKEKIFPESSNSSQIVKFNVKLDRQQPTANKYFNSLYIEYKNIRITIGNIFENTYNPDLQQLSFGNITVPAIYRKNGIQDYLINDLLNQYPQTKIVTASFIRTNEHVFLAYLLYYLSKNQIIDIKEHSYFSEKKQYANFLMALSPNMLHDLVIKHCSLLPSHLLGDAIEAAIMETPFYLSFKKHGLSQVCSHHFKISNKRTLHDKENKFFQDNQHIRNLLLNKGRHLSSKEEMLSRINIVFSLCFEK